MDCEIQWNILGLAAWETRFSQIRRANLLQSYSYALAACVVNHQQARWGLIKIDGAEAGLVQVLEAKALGGLMHALIIDRGPLWFEGFGNAEHLQAFATEINRQFPKHLGRARRFIPEAQGVQDLPGFKKTTAMPYKTIWLDLTKSEEHLRRGLRKNWRGSLKKAEAANLDIEWDERGLTLPSLIDGYTRDKKTKGYDGPSVKILMELAKNFVPQKKLLIGRALTNDKLCASILILCHGTSATYQIGWSNDTGRKLAAHHFLLWQALLKLKQNNIQDFDLGGVNDETAQGIKTFKEGMGGTLVTLSGLYT